jgi:CBS domain-containing protein/ribosome-associated translation inhibitor RaiA
MLRSQIDSVGTDRLMNTDFKTIGPEDRVSDALRIMRESGMQDIPVTEGNEYAGSMSYGTLIRKKSVKLDSKIRTLMTGAPSVCKDAKITEVAELMIANNARQIPVLERKKVKGVISRSALIEIVADIRAFREIRVWEIMTSSVETVRENDDLETALDIIRGLDIRTVPVVDDKMEVIGIVGMREIIDHNWKRNDRQTAGDISGESTRPGLLAGTFCATAPKTISWDDTVGEAAEIMLSSSISTLPVVEDNKLVGILTQYDIIELMAACKEREMMFVQISGLDDKDKGLSDSIYGLIEREMGKISKVRKPQSLTVHAAKHKAQGINNKYSLSARLILDNGVIVAKESEWDLIKGFEDLMKKLDAMVMERKDMEIDHRKKIV